MSQTGLLLLLFFCHFLGDFSPLSTAWMIRAKESGKPLFPIFCHALVHASLMGVVLLFWSSFQTEMTGKLVLFQLGTHFIIDVWKGRMNIWFPVFADRYNKFHWMLFGIDQFFHATVIILMVHYAAQ